MKKIITLILLLIPLSISAAGEQIIETAELYYKNGEYYSAITETMRYQHLYPGADLYSRSMILMGKSYYKGGRPDLAIGTFSDCYNRFADKREGEEALFYSGIVRILTGSYYFGARTFQEYNFVYKGGIFYEDSVFSLCTAKALAENYDDAARLLDGYKKTFPGGKYSAEADKLAGLINERKNRDRKNPLVAGLSSAVIPGSGFFYTGDYRLGVISFLTNGALLFLAYDGYRKDNSFQMIFFSVVEFSFYNYSIVGSIKSAQDYNSSSSFRKEALMGFRISF